ELLGHLHGLAAGEVQLAGGFLLQSRGGEGGRRAALGLLLLDALHLVVRAVQGFDYRARIGFVLKVGLLAAHLVEGGMEGVLLPARGTLAEVGLDRPVLLGDEGLYLALAFHHQSHRHALHAARRETPADLLPEQGREAVAHQAVKHAPGLLGVHEVHIYSTRAGNGALDSPRGYLIELDPVDGLVVLSGPGYLADMPCYGLALAVGVGC